MELAEAQYGLSDNEEAILYLMELTTEGLQRFCIAQLECGADIVQCGDSLAFLDVISPANKSANNRRNSGYRIQFKS